MLTQIHSEATQVRENKNNNNNKNLGAVAPPTGK